MSDMLNHAGHSLGGALATLAAYDFATAAQAVGKTLNLAVYTFGCPRVGNHAFARDFEEVTLEILAPACGSWSVLSGLHWSGGSCLVRLPCPHQRSQNSLRDTPAVFKLAKWQHHPAPALASRYLVH